MTRRRRDPAPGRFSALALGVHAAFYVLVLTSATRFVTRHGSQGPVVAVVMLSVGLTLGYTALLMGTRRPTRRSQALAVVGLVAVWGVLVVLAPSFAWCAFPLFFLCRSLVRPPLAYVLVAVVAGLTSAALFRLSDGLDWAALVGPPCAALLLTLVYDTIEADAAARLRLQEEVAAAQARTADAERSAEVFAERERLAREIHDTITQDLASTLLVLEAVDQTWGLPAGTAHDDVRKAIGSVRAGLAQTRNLVHDLASPRLDTDGFHAGLLTALRGQVPAAEMTIYGEPEQVPADVSHAILRIVQSAAANVRLHAAAGTVGLTLTYLPRTLLLDIFDDGCGFDRHAVADPSDQGGYGLRAMHQRVAQLGGSLTIETAPGEGTVVAVEIPLSTDRQEAP